METKILPGQRESARVVSPDALLASVYMLNTTARREGAGTPPPPTPPFLHSFVFIFRPLSTSAGPRPSVIRLTGGMIYTSGLKSFSLSSDAARYLFSVTVIMAMMKACLGRRPRAAWKLRKCVIEISSLNNDVRGFNYCNVPQGIYTTGSTMETEVYKLKMHLVMEKTLFC